MSNLAPSIAPRHTYDRLTYSCFVGVDEVLGKSSAPMHRVKTLLTCFTNPMEPTIYGRARYSHLDDEMWKGYVYLFICFVTPAYRHDPIASPIEKPITADDFHWRTANDIDVTSPGRRERSKVTL